MHCYNLFYSVFAARLILCFLSLHQQHFVTAQFQFITVFRCTLKMPFLDPEGGSQNATLVVVVVISSL